jgi:hypothetical protein
VVNVTFSIGVDDKATVAVTRGTARRSAQEPRIDGDVTIVYSGDDVDHAKAVTSEWLARMGS